MHYAGPRACGQGTELSLRLRAVRVGSGWFRSVWGFGWDSELGLRAGLGSGIWDCARGLSSPTRELLSRLLLSGPLKILELELEPHTTTSLVLCYSFDPRF